MAILKYENRTELKLSKNIDVYDFRCKCGGKHPILIDIDLINIIEKTGIVLNASKIDVKSGFRCPKHDKKVGGSGKGPHTLGKGADVIFYDQNGMKIPSKIVCLVLEDMGYNFGVGYRSGKNQYETHIDTKKRGYRYYFDEGYKPYRSCKGSFYKYFGMRKKTGYTGIFPKLPRRGYFYAKYNVITKKYKIVDTGEEVKKLQKFLSWALDINLKINGKYDGKLGKDTSNAIKQFQKLVGLKKVDGKFGKDTLAKAKSFVK